MTLRAWYTQSMHVDLLNDRIYSAGLRGAAQTVLNKFMGHAEGSSRSDFAWLAAVTVQRAQQLRMIKKF